MVMHGHTVQQRAGCDTGEGVSGLRRFKRRKNGTAVTEQNRAESWADFKEKLGLISGWTQLVMTPTAEGDRWATTRHCRNKCNEGFYKTLICQLKVV